MRVKGMNFKEIQCIRAKNKKYGCDIFFAMYSKSVNFKCTIVIKKKLIALAVTRNKIRRRIRSIIQQVLKKTILNVHIMIILNKNNLKQLNCNENCLEIYSFNNLQLYLNTFFDFIEKMV